MIKNKTTKVCENGLTNCRSIEDGSTDVPCDRIALNIWDHQDLFDALTSNDVEAMEQLLLTHSPSILRGYFVYETDCKETCTKYIPTLPLHVAAISVALDVIKLFLQHRYRCVYDTDIGGNNIVHSLVVAAAISPENAVDLIETYQFLCKFMSSEDIAKLLKLENGEGFRPLELAAHIGNPTIVLAIMNTPGVYKIKEVRKGYVTETWYDVTEYENGQRNWCTPLLFMTYADRSLLETWTADSGAKAAVLYDIYKTWSKIKIQINISALLFWFLIRLGLVALYFVIALSENYTGGQIICDRFPRLNFSETTSKILFGITISMAGLMLLFDIGESLFLVFNLNLRSRSSILGRKKKIAVNFATQRMCQFCVCLSVVISVSLMAQQNATTNSLIVVGVIQGIIPNIALWSLLLFAQFIPSLSKSLISIEHMFKDVLYFTVVFTLQMLPFVIAIGLFLNHNAPACVDGYSDFFKSCYTTFLLMLNTFDLSSLQVRYIGVLYVVHFIFVFTVGILLVNFLIAQMSSTAAGLCGKEDLVVQMNRTALALTVEGRMFWMLKCVYLKRKTRVFKMHKDRLCVVVKSCHLARSRNCKPNT